MRASDLTDFLASGGIGVIGKTLYYSFVPAQPDALVVVTPTGGFAPDMELPTGDPTFQIRVRAKTFEEAEDMAAAIAALFKDESGRAKENFMAGNAYVYYVRWMQEPTTAFIGYDANDRAEFSLNLHLHVRRD